MCDSCCKWNHIDCEGVKNPEIYALAEDDAYKYYCIACTKARKPKQCLSITRKQTPPESSSEGEKDAGPQEETVTPFEEES